MTELHDRQAVSEEQTTGAKESWEATWEDWWRTDRVDAMGWAALFLWGAVVVLASYTSFRDDFDWWNGWGVFLAGAGVIVLIQTLVRLRMPEYRSKWGWTLFWGTILLAGGLAELASPVWYALPLVAIAVVILKDVFARSR